MKAVILAGGRGERLKNITNSIPKPFISIGDKPLLLHQIEWLKRYGIIDIIIITGYLSHIIENYFGDGKTFGVKINYFRENSPLGTAGGIKEIEHLLKDDFVLLYGDVMLDINLNRLVKFHKDKKSICTLVLHPNEHPFDSDLVETDGEKRVTAFHLKPHSPSLYFRNLVNAGVYIVSFFLFRHIQKGVKSDIIRDVLSKIVMSENLFGYMSAEYMKDIGIEDRLTEVENDYLCGKISNLNCEKKRKAIFLDRDGIINKQKGLITNIDDLELIDGVIDSIKKINRSEFLAVVLTNQPVIARNLCSMEELEKIHKKMETMLGHEGAKLDAIYFCPHHPQKGFPEENSEYKIACDCRKPQIGMVKKAEEEFNIDIKNSFIIGDTWRDIKTGKNAGMRTILVPISATYGDETIVPDLSFNSLSDAVDFILNGLP